MITTRNTDNDNSLFYTFLFYVLEIHVFISCKISLLANSEYFQKISWLVFLFNYQ